MTRSKYIARLQDLFGVTKSELTIVGLLALGLLCGTFYRVQTHDLKSELTKQEVLSALDSLAETEATTFIGTDMQGDSYPDLAAKDTVVSKKSDFPKSNKKELPDSRIDINKASKTQLMELPGVGEKTAEKIIEYRKSSPFRKPEDIMNVKGIGEKKFEKMKEYIIGN